MTSRGTFTPLERPPRDHVLCIAHRGASAYAPENSLDAFRRAAEMQADLVEVDIQITSDEQPVIAHDPSLKRVYGVAQNIRDLTLEHLEAVTHGPGLHPVPTFEAVAQLCAELKMGLYLDIKEFNREAFQSVWQSLNLNGLKDVAIFGSFRPDWLAEIKAIFPGVKTSILFGSTYVNPVRLAEAIQADYIHPCWENAAPEPHRLLTPEWIQAVRQAKLGIVTWHEERPAEMEALIQLGVDGICSDTPDVLSKLALDRRF